MEGLKLRKPFRGNKVTLEVEPSKDATALVTISSKGYGMQYSEGICF